MDSSALYRILSDTTFTFRKGNVVRNDSGGSELAEGTVTIDMMPHVGEARGNLTLVDVEFLVVGVDKEAAETHRDDFLSLMNAYPDQARLAAGPSYIEVGAVVGSQEAAFRLFALGEVLGMWKVITPKRLGIDGERATMMAGSGLIMISGFRTNTPKLRSSKATPHEIGRKIDIRA